MDRFMCVSIKLNVEKETRIIISKLERRFEHNTRMKHKQAHPSH